MSHVAHNCTCGHFLDLHLPKQYAALAGRLCSTVGCDCMSPQIAESVVLPTHDHRGNPVPLEAPGGSMFGLAPKSCDCATCQALYEQLTRAGAA